MAGDFVVEQNKLNRSFADDKYEKVGYRVVKVAIFVLEGLTGVRCDY